MSTANLRMTTVPVTSKYGLRTLQTTGKLNFHKGTDHAFGNQMGVSAYGDGIVTHAGWGTGADAERGIWVGIEHATGIATSAHSLSRVTVKKGQRVKMGDIIGYGGKTAAGASGNHCHKGLWLNGVHYDSQKFLKPGVVVTISNTGIVSAVGSKPFTPPPAPTAPAKTRRKNKMYLDWDTGNTGYLNTEDGCLGLPSVQVYNLFYRLINSDQLLSPFAPLQQVPGGRVGRPESFLKAEKDIMHAHLRLLSVQKQTGVEIDPTKLASAVADELRKKGITVELKDLEWTAETGELIAKQVATAFDVAVPRISNAIVKAQGAALSAAVPVI